MSPSLKINLSVVGTGWMNLSLATGERQFATSFSHTPYDSLTQLAEALHALCANNLSTKASFNAEPVEYELHLEPGRDIDSACVRLVRSPSSARAAGVEGEVFVAELSRRELGLAFWRALRRLETELAQLAAPEWSHPFPHAAVARLGAALKGPAQNV